VQYILKETEGLSPEAALKRRKEIIAQFEANGCRAMPESALIGVAVNHAVRLSVDNGSRFVEIDDDLNVRLT